MKRCLASAALIACALGAVGATQQPEQQPVFRGSRDTVRVFATVTDRDGRLATTLKQEDFEVRDEGKPQPITQFDNTPQPIRLIVMLDVSGSMEGNAPLLRAAGAQLFGRLLKDDVARVGSVRERRHNQPVVHQRCRASSTPRCRRRSCPTRRRRSGARSIRRWEPSARRTIAAR